MTTTDKPETGQPFYQWDDNDADDRQAEWERQIKEAQDG